MSSSKVQMSSIKVQVSYMIQDRVSAANKVVQTFKGENARLVHRGMKYGTSRLQSSQLLICGKPSHCTLNP